MSSSLRGVLLGLVASLTFWACTEEEPFQGMHADAYPSGLAAATHDFIAGSAIALPPSWSYNIGRQGAESWQFSLSPEPFNLGGRCDPNGPLASKLLARAGVFVTGFAYPSNFPPAASKYEQSPGTFVLDERTLANYEGFCHPTYRIDFELDEHYVSIHVALHKRAQDATIEETLDVLNSIQT